jgi:hypothetical protein
MTSQLYMGENKAEWAGCQADLSFWDEILSRHRSGRYLFKTRAKALLADYLRLAESKSAKSKSGNHNGSAVVLKAAVLLASNQKSDKLKIE